jgi:hypothetical protein
MNRRHALVISTLSAVLVGSLMAVMAYSRFKKIEKRGPAPESVAQILPGDVNAVAASVSAVFNNWSDFDRADRVGGYQNKFPRDSQWSRFFLFCKDDSRHPLFPTDEEILRNRGVDSFVERYARVAPGLRTGDFYLYEPSGDYYWESEYFYDGRPAKFRCSFLIHLEPAGNSTTKVEIFEYQPTIWVGEYLGLSAHALLPTSLHDIRAAEATTTDRKMVLSTIERSNNSQNSTNVQNPSTWNERPGLN